jgi:hypothetical protein
MATLLSTGPASRGAGHGERDALTGPEFDAEADRRDPGTGRWSRSGGGPLERAGRPGV